jgi:hypothetical protein
VHVKQVEARRLGTEACASHLDTARHLVAEHWDAITTVAGQLTNRAADSPLLSRAELDAMAAAPGFALGPLCRETRPGCDPTRA